MVLLSAWLSTPAEAARREDPLAGLTSSQRRVFQNYTRLYCQQFFRFDDRFVLLPNYKRSRENSNGRSYKQAEEQMTEIKAVGGKYSGKEVANRPPAAEVIVSARVIPSIDVGHYGFVNSVIIKDILGPNEMIITSIELIPTSEVGTTNNTKRKAAVEQQKAYAYQTFRLLGFPTKDLKPGQKYYGPRKKGLQVAVMSTDPQHKFVLVNYDRLDRVRTSDFAEALAYVQIEPLQFIEMVRTNREKDKADGDKHSLISIYQRFYNRYRPKRLSSTTRPPATVHQEEPKPEPEPEPKPEVQPEPRPTTDREKLEWDKPEPNPEPRPEPEPEEENEDDDWDYEEDTQKDSDTPSFFGIPL